MESFWQDLRHAVRALRNSAGFTLIAMITLGLGMAVNTTVFSVINGVLLRPLPVPHAEQITVLAMQQAGTLGLQKFSYPDFQDIAKQADAFSDIFAYRETLRGLVADHKGDHCVLARVTGNYFAALGIKPALGRLILPTEGQTPGADSVVVLGYAYWQRRFNGDRSVIGKQVEINGHAATIVGVTPKGFQGTYSIVNNDGYIPLSAAFDDDEDAVKDVQDLWTHREQRSLSLMGRLKPGVGLKQARASLSLVARRIAEQYPETEKGVTIQAFPEKLARPDPDPDNTIPAVSLAFAILAALVLLVACFNIANVLLVRATVRQREMGIRAALGAGRARLVRQHLTESLLLAFLGGATGLVLGSWACGYLSSLPLGTDLPIVFDFHPDVRVYFFALIVVLLTGLIVGIIPALRVARNDVNSVLREGSRGSSEGPRRHFVRNTLVVAQLAGSLLLLVVAGLFTRSLGKAQRLDLGFNPDHVLNFSVDVQQSGYNEAQGRAFYKQLADRVRALPGVVSAAEAFSVPMGFYSSSGPVTAEGHPVEAGKEPPNVGYNPVTPGYFETVQIPLVSGRDFRDSDDAKSPHVAIINQEMAKKFWPNENPIGKRFSTNAVAGKPVEIEVVGVARTAKYQSVVEDPPQPYFYVPFEQQYLPLRVIHLRTSLPPESLRLPIQSLFREIAPGLAPTQMQTMREALDGVNGFFIFRFAVQLTGTMGLLGLVLAVVGVYSVVSYAAAQRTHEIGIRMALGAIPRDILRLVLRQSLMVVVIGLAVGLVLAFAATQAIANLFVGVRPTDPLTFATVALLLSFIALAACWIPARRATRVSPLVALRYE